MTTATPSAAGRLLNDLPDKAKTIIRNNRTTTQANSVNIGLVPKPPGRRSRDFTIFDKMQAGGKIEVSKDTYNNLLVSGLGRIHYRIALMPDYRASCAERLRTPTLT